MKTLKIKITNRERVEPQIEWGPVNHNDLIGRELIRIIDVDYLTELVEQGRASLVSDDNGVQEYEYKYS